MNSKASSLIYLDGHSLTIEQVVDVARHYQQVAVSPVAAEKVRLSRQMVDDMVEQQKIAYGITTGFGKLCDQFISKKDVNRLQENLIVSHACGVGEPFPAEVVRGIMLLRLNALLQGHSGVRLETLHLLAEMLNKKVHPVIPQQGSLGASGDLAPLSHMVLVMIGRGKAEFCGKQLSGQQALQAAGLSPVQLMAKEGLALINGTQAMAALLALALYDAKNLIENADAISALTIEALHGIPAAFDPKIHALRPHPGQQAAAAHLLDLLQGSQRVTRPGEKKVQDAYSLRCIPQVHGATRDTLNYVWQVVSREINSVTDNPLLFPDTGEVLSGGNFHGQPLALAADFLAIAMAELGNISERRTERLVNPSLSKLPAFLTEKSGIHSGMMILQYSAASIVSENKGLCTPSSIDSIPSSANQEDHVSMGTTAARKLRTVIHNAIKILAIEWLCAAQAVEFGEGKLGRGTQKAYRLLRREVRKLEEDRELYQDIEKAIQLLSQGRIELVN